MAAIRSANTKPERILFSALRGARVYFRRHYRVGRVSIDIAQPRVKRAVFVDGDFWHGRELVKRRGRLPSYWVEKIEGNVRRDRRNRAALRRSGWAVLRVWEHQVKQQPEAVVRRIGAFLR